MTVSYLDCEDNDSYAFREYPNLTETQRLHQVLLPDMSGDSHESVRRCDECGDILDKWNIPLSGLFIKNWTFANQVNPSFVVTCS